MRYVVFTLSKNVVEIELGGFQSIVGDVIVGLYSRDDNQFYNGKVDVSYFQSGFYMKRVYVNAIVEVIKDTLVTWGSDSTNTRLLFFTPTDIMMKALTHITAHFLEFNCEIMHGKSKIISPYVDALHHGELYNLKIPVKSRDTNGLLRWISEDYNNRVRYVKTGWPVWRTKYEPRLLLDNEDTSNAKKNTRW